MYTHHIPTNIAPNTIRAEQVISEATESSVQKRYQTSSQQLLRKYNSRLFICQNNLLHGIGLVLEVLGFAQGVRGEEELLVPVQTLGGLYAGNLE